MRQVCLLRIKAHADLDGAAGLVGIPRREGAVGVARGGLGLVTAQRRHQLALHIHQLLHVPERHLQRTGFIKLGIASSLKLLPPALFMPAFWGPPVLQSAHCPAAPVFLHTQQQSLCTQAEHQPAVSACVQDLLKVMPSPMHLSNHRYSAGQGHTLRSLRCRPERWFFRSRSSLDTVSMSRMAVVYFRLR